MQDIFRRAIYWGPYDPQITLPFPQAFFRVYLTLKTPAYPLWFLYPLSLFSAITPVIWVFLLTEIGRSLIKLATCLWFLVVVLGTAPAAYLSGLDLMKGTSLETLFDTVVNPPKI
jgi:hypothetical protein